MRARASGLLPGLPLGLLLLALGACYRPNYSGPYACDPKHGTADCPEGFRCIDRLCVAPGAEASDMGPGSACAGAGTLLVMAHGGRVWACPGSFPAGGVGSLCSAAPGTHVCGSDPRDDLLLALLDCDQLAGFYAAQSDLVVMPSRMNANYDAMCDAPPGSGTHAILGCGSAAGAVTLNPPDCHALHHALLCPASGAWSCSLQQGLFDAAHDAAADSTGGALCCASDPIPR